MIKHLLLIVAVFAFFYSTSQTPPKNPNGQNVLNLVDSLRHDEACVNKQFSIVFYIILDSIYSVRSSTPAMLKKIVDSLNSTFKPICVSFANCSTVFIPNYPYNRWKKSMTDPVVTSNWYTQKTINLYICDSIKFEATNSEQASYAYRPWDLPGDSVKDVIVMESFKNTPQYTSSNFEINFAKLFHSMGHFFGLVHTFDELNPTSPAVPPPPIGITSQEFADGSNGCCHGDMLGDTEADPGTFYRIDGKGNSYIHPTDNYMSWYGGCRFTQQQYNKMAKIILQKRMYLH